LVKTEKNTKHSNGRENLKLSSGDVKYDESGDDPPHFAVVAKM